MKTQLEINCRNLHRTLLVEKGSTAWDLALQLEKELGFKPLAAVINHRCENLCFEFYHPAQVEFVGLKSALGHRAYTRSLTFMVAAAVEELLPGSRFRLKYAVSNGYYCKIYFAGPDPLKDTLPSEKIAATANERIAEWIPKIKEKVMEISAKAIPFEQVEEETSIARKKFEQAGRCDVTSILSNVGELYTRYCRMGRHIDYYYGPLVHDTGEVCHFDLIPYINGLLLRLPDRNNPDALAPIVRQEKMYQVFQEYTRWNSLMRVPTVGAMNEAIAKGYASDMIKVGESLQEKKIGQIADAVLERKNVKIVLIAGPSSSGKTTFSKRLSVALAVNGLRPIALSLDDYFVNRDQTPLDENGEYDYESFHALDLNLFNTQLKQLLHGESVNIPTFNFTKGEKEYHPDRWLKMKENDILILEGIHALNPDLLPQIDNEVQYRIYASALTSLSLDIHNRIPTTDNRLLRRIIRDSRYRGTSCQATIARWPSVRAGEDKWIFPFQENADSVFNSALIFELSVLKPFVEPELRKVPQQAPEHAEARRLLLFLKHILPIQADEIPSTSLLREFVGGSSFNY